MKSQRAFSERLLMNRMKKNKSKYYGLIKLLQIKAKKQIPLNPKLIVNKKIDNSENKTALEGLKLIHKLNNSFYKKRINIDETLKESQDFLDRFNYFKSAQDKDIFKKIEKKQIALSSVLKSYEDKGIYFQEDFINKNIYNKSGILLRKKMLIEDYYTDQVKQGGDKNKKIIKYENFLGKLSKDAEKTLLLKSPYQDPQLLKELEEIKEDNKNDFENIVDLKTKEIIDKLINENNLLKNLIELDKKNFEKRINKIEKENKTDNDKIIFFSNNSVINDNKEENNIGDKSIENYNISKITKENKSIFHDKDSINNFNDDDIRTTKREKPYTYRAIFTRNNNNLFNTNEKTVRMRSILKLDSSLPSIIIRDKKSDKKLSFNYSIENSLSNIKTTESGIFRSRLKSKNLTRKEQSQIFPILFEQIHNKRKSNTRNIKIINSLITDKSLDKNSFMIKNNSMPNFLKIENTYDYLLKNKNKRKKVGEKLKEYFGENIENINKIDKKNNGIKILNDFNNIKIRIIQKQSNNEIYTKYKDIIPDKLKQNIFLNKSVDKKINNGVTYFARHYFNKLNKLKDKDIY